MMRKLDTIVIHCSKTKAREDIGVKEIAFQHKQQGYISIGFHYVIRRDGTLEEGRPIEKPAMFNGVYNKTSINICLVGGADRTGEPLNNYTVPQWNTLRILVEDLIQKYHIYKVCSHSVIDANSFEPSFNVEQWKINNYEPITD